MLKIFLHVKEKLNFKKIARRAGFFYTRQCATPMGLFVHWRARFRLLKKRFRLGKECLRLRGPLRLLRRILRNLTDSLD